MMRWFDHGDASCGYRMWADRAFGGLEGLGIIWAENQKKWLDFVATTKARVAEQIA